MNVRLSLCLLSVAASPGLVARERVLVTAAQQVARPFAIINVTAIDVAAGARLPNRAVVVERNRIIAMGAAAGAPIPAQAIRIDGAGKFPSRGQLDLLPARD